MNYKIIVKPEAESDIFESTVWYNDKRIGLGNEFLNALDEEIIRIKTNPYLFAVKYKKTRIAFVNRFPFGIHFQIENDRIIILAILHTSRDPKIWEKR